MLFLASLVYRTLTTQNSRPTIRNTVTAITTNVGNRFGSFMTAIAHPQSRILLLWTLAGAKMPVRAVSFPFIHRKPFGCTSLQNPKGRGAGYG